MFKWVVLLSALIAVVSSQNGNYCGRTWTEALACTRQCPGGLNGECGPGEMCYGGVTCSQPSRPSSTSSSNFCGRTWAEATSCTRQCPGGVDSECSPGESCFGGVSCSRAEESPSLSSSSSFCGKTWEEATSCARPCPGGVDIECGPGEMCYGGVTCGGSSAAPEKHECGLGLECPLKACCSVWGFCGWTDDFCNDECQSNCDKDIGPPNECKADVKMTVNAGYYASWAADRECRKVPASELDATGFTHLIYAFAGIDNVGRIEKMAESDEARFVEFNNLKGKHPNLKTMIAVGGWAFNDPPTEKRFTNMASSQQNRRNFINSVLEFLRKYKFDGLDIDWEYPGAPDRGGRPEDFRNYVDLVKELRAAFNSAPEKFLLTMAVPLSNWYLRHFDVTELAKHLDWFNVMSYDIHGVWDATIPSLGPYVASHTNMTEIKQGIEMFFKNGVPSDKLVLGLGAYGRTYTLEDPACNHVGCKFVSGGKKGRCTGASGFLGIMEIEEIISQDTHQRLEKKEDAGVMVLVTGDNQWISFDNEETLAIKRSYAEGMCFRGMMLWSVDMRSNQAGPSLDIERIAEKIKPIYYFDKDAGDECFPDIRVEKDWHKLDPEREGICSPFNPQAPVYYDYEECRHQDEIVFQFVTWYGKQPSCFDIGVWETGNHGDDYERVLVWYSRRHERVTKVKYHQHSGWYIVTVDQGAPVENGRPVIYVGKNSHGAYHFGCKFYSKNIAGIFELVTDAFGVPVRKCAGSCGYWDDYRDVRNTHYILRDSTLEYRKGRERANPDNKEDAIQCQYEWDCDPDHGRHPSVTGASSKKRACEFYDYIKQQKGGLCPSTMDSNCDGSLKCGRNGDGKYICCEDTTPFWNGREYCHGTLNNGDRCTVDKQCKSGACGRESAGGNAPKVCCHSGKVTRSWGYDYCTDMPKGTRCYTDGMCASGDCDGNWIGLCPCKCT